MRDIPEFEMGYICDGHGDPVHDTAVAYSGLGDERELRLEGEDASGILPRIVSALNVHDDLVAALQAVLRVADRQTVEFDLARAALAKATLA